MRPPLPPLETRVDRFDLAVGTAAEFLRSAWPELRDVSFDPGRKYSVPWVSGMVGIGYNPKKTGRELTSVEDLFDPKFKGQVTMLTEMRDTRGLIMLGLGADPTKATLADATAACAKSIRNLPCPPLASRIVPMPSKRTSWRSAIR